MSVPRLPVAALAQSIAGIAALCALDAVIKHATSLAPVGYVTLGRYVAGSIFAITIWYAAGRPRITRAMLPAQALRGVLIAVTAFTFFYALTQLPLAEVLVIAFTAPLLIPPLAALFLGERLQPRTLVAATLGFAGVLVTVQGAPLFEGGRLWGVVAALVSSVTYALTAIILRARAAQDGATVTTLLGSLVPMLVLSPVAIGADPPTWELALWLVLAGLFGNLGIQLLARAYAQAEAQVLSVLEFTALIWAALFGWVFFGEPVRPAVWAGAAIVIAACIWAAQPGPAAPAPG